MAWIPLAMTAAGALGGMFGKKSSTWSGTKPSMKKFETLSHDQKAQLHDLLKHPGRLGLDITQNPMYQQGGDFYSKLMSQDPEMMKQFEAPYMRQFNEQIVPSLSEQFAGAGALSSSGFGQALGSAGAGLQERLASLRGMLGMQAAQGALGYAQAPGQEALSRLGIGLGTQPFGYQQMGGQPGIGSGLSSGLMQGGSQALSMMSILKMMGYGG